MSQRFGVPCAAACVTATETPAMVMVAERDVPELAAIARAALPGPVIADGPVRVIQLGRPEIVHGQKAVAPTAMVWLPPAEATGRVEGTPVYAQEEPAGVRTRMRPLLSATSTLPPELTATSNGLFSSALA